MEFFYLVLICMAVILFFKGMVKTFRRAPIVAILMLIFVGPLWICWAIVEMFTGEIKPKVIYVKNVD